MRCAPRARRSRSSGPTVWCAWSATSARVQAKAGTQAAIDGLKLAEGPRDMSRVATLAEKNGGKTRAILKVARPRRDPADVAAFDLAAWMLGAMLTLFGFVASAKAAVERMTQRHIGPQARKAGRRATR